MKKYFSIIFCLLITMFYGQAPEIDWMQYYGGTNTELMGSLIKTSDGGLLFGGYSNSGISGIKTEDRIGYNQDYWVVKTDSDGNLEWEKTIGAGDPTPFGELEAEIFHEVREASDGGFFLGGNSDSPPFGSKTEPNYGRQDYWIVKINSMGNIVWQKDIGGTDYEEGYALESTPDGGCIVGGYSKSGISGNKTVTNYGFKDYWVVKLSETGDIQWQKEYGGTSEDILNSMIVLDNQEYILAGVSASTISGNKTENSKGFGDFWILKIDSTGNIIWQKTIGGNSGDILYSSAKTSDGFVFSGVSYSDISFDKTEVCRGGSDYWMVKTDFEGTVLWDKTYGGDLNDDTSGFVAMSDESGFVLAGTSYSGISGDKTVVNYGEYNGWVVRTDSNGEVLWQKGIGGSYADVINNALELPDSTILLGGNSSSQISGNITETNYGGMDYWLVKLEQEQLAINEIAPNEIAVYPNPTLKDINISFTENQEKLDVIVYNSLLQIISTTHFNDTSRVNVTLQGSSGIYFIKVTNEHGKVYHAKIIKQ